MFSTFVKLIQFKSYANQTTRGEGGGLLLKYYTICFQTKSEGNDLPPIGMGSISTTTTAEDLFLKRLDIMIHVVRNFNFIG